MNMGIKRKLLFYFTLFIFVLAVSLLVNNYDFDLWARLIAGMGVIEGHQVIKTDFLSYTPTHTWWDHEWGSGVIFYLVLKYLGPYSLVILQALFTFGIFLTVAKIVKLKYNVMPYCLFIYIFAIMALNQNFSSPVRCHMFSFLLFTLFIYILELARKGKCKFLILIPLITIFWNNVHGGVVSGLGLLAMYAFGEFLNKKNWKQYVYTLIPSVIFLVINPYGFEYIKFLFSATTMERPDISEWWGIFSKYQMNRQIMFKIFMLSIIGTEVYTVVKNIKNSNFAKWYSEQDKVKWIVLVVTLYLAISHVKMIPFFVISACCYCYDDIYNLGKKLNIPAFTEKIIYIMVIIMSIFSLASKEYTVPLNYAAYPVREVEFIKINNLKGNILSNFGLGSYISYKLYPNNLIYMDGRYEEVYYDEMIPLLKKFFLVNPGWDDVLKKYPPEIMIIEKYYPVYDTLKNSEDWKLVFEGEVFGVFVQKDNLQADYSMPAKEIDYYKDTLFDTDIKF